MPGCSKTPVEHARIAKDESVPVEKRLESVRALTDQTLLADVALNAGKFFFFQDELDRRHDGRAIRLAALEKLTDQPLLADMAKGGNDESAMDAEWRRRLFAHEMEMSLWVMMRTNHYR
jgi:hypothetical protein